MALCRNAKPASVVYLLYLIVRLRSTAVIRRLRKHKMRKGNEMGIIETKGLTKIYRRYQKQEGIVGSIKGLFHREYEEKAAVKEMDLCVEEGEFIGLIGPNGAGKTTLVKMLTGIIAPSSGMVNVMGYYPNKLENAFKKQYAIVMGQKSQLFFELTTGDTLNLFKEIYEIPHREYQQNKNYFVELFQVKDLMNVQVRTLSLGERMKMELIAALLHNPKVLFLDEPTIGLDAVASRQMREFLKEVNREKNTTIVLTSHYMEDIKMLCRRSVVVNHGCKIYDGDTEALFEKYQKNKRISVTFPRKVTLDLQSIGGIVLEEEGFKKVIGVPRESSSQAVAYIMKFSPMDITIEEEEIGKVVERIYEQEEAAYA